LPTHVVLDGVVGRILHPLIRLDPEKLLKLLHWVRTLRWLGSNHFCELCTWFTTYCRCSVAKLRDRTCKLL